jgi:hypothetical protein
MIFSRAAFVASDIHLVKAVLSTIEAHAALAQAVTVITSTLIAVIALLYAIKSLWTLQRQTEANVAMTTETFRPIVEVLGGSLGNTSQVDFVNKGNGPALNFRWRDNSVPERWKAFRTNVVAPQEKGALTGEFDWKKGLVLSYNSVAHREEICTRIKFGPDGTVSNMHDISQGAAVTRQGWTLLDPDAAIPAWHPELIRAMPPMKRLAHWWRLKRGRELRLPGNQR